MMVLIDTKAVSRKVSADILAISANVTDTLKEYNRPVSHLARHQRPARERYIVRIASRENVDNQAPRNTNFTQ